MATMSARYTVIDGEVVAQERGGIRHQLVPDPLGSTVALYDDAGTKTDTFSYWPYGESSSRTGSTNVKFQYVGTLGYYTNSSSKAYVRARTYDFAKTAWITKDPIGIGDLDYNLYRYCENKPVSNIDITGLKMCFKYVLFTTFGDLGSDKQGFKQNKLQPGDLACGDWNATDLQHRYPKTHDLCIPFGTRVYCYPQGKGAPDPFWGTIRDYGVYDLKNPPFPKDGWIDIWDPDRSKKYKSYWGYAGINVPDNKSCPKGWSTKEQLWPWDYPPPNYTRPNPSIIFSK